jgi:hypothetical protein
LIECINGSFSRRESGDEPTARASLLQTKKEQGD